MPTTKTSPDYSFFSDAMEPEGSLLNCYYSYLPILLINSFNNPKISVFAKHSLTIKQPV